MVAFLTVSEFLFVRYDLPVRPWKKLIPNVPIYGGIECAEGGRREQCLTAAGYRKAARHLWRRRRRHLPVQLLHHPRARNGGLRAAVRGAQGDWRPEDASGPIAAKRRAPAAEGVPDHLLESTSGRRQGPRRRGAEHYNLTWVPEEGLDRGRPTWPARHADQRPLDSFHAGGPGTNEASSTP